VLFTRPGLQQLVTATKLGTLHLRMPRRVARKTPVKMTLGACDHQSKLVGGRQHFIVYRQHVAAARTRPTQWITVGVNKELRVVCLICTAQPRKDLIAMH